MVRTSVEGQLVGAASPRLRSGLSSEVLVLRDVIHDIGIAPYYHIFLFLVSRNDYLGVSCVANLRVAGRRQDMVVDVVHDKDTLKDRPLPILQNSNTRPTGGMPLIKSSA